MKGLTDFNDLHLHRGLDEVRRQLLRAANDDSVQRSFEGGEAPEEGPPVPPVEAYEQADDDVNADYSPKGEDWYDWLQRDQRSGLIKSHAGNLEAIIRNDPRWEDVLAYCDFSYRVLFLKKPPFEISKAGELDDADIARIRIWFHRQYRMTPPSRGEVMDAILVSAQRQRFHPVRSYLQKLRWDDVPRLASWLTGAFDARGNAEYLAAVSTKFLVGAVARVMLPGCKMDNVLILEGDQGKGKSSAIGALFGEDWFNDSPLPLGDKEAYQLIQGVWGNEMAELDALNKAETTTAKAFFSQRRDRFRPPYGHAVQDFKRQTVFIGTTNQDEYLKDYSGNRRYWPAYCRKADVQWVKDNRDQLWAEAFKLYQDGVTWWVDNEDLQVLFESEQDSRFQRDPWEDKLEEFLNDTTARYYTAYQLLKDGLGLDAGHHQRAHMNRLAPIMKSLGWHKRRLDLPDPKKGGKKRRQWAYQRPPEEGAPPLPGDEGEE